MLHKAFSRLTEEERIKKLDTIIRQNTENLLNAELIQVLVKELHFNTQYVIAVHPVKKDCCEALIKKNVLHIYIPEHQINNERD